MDIALTLLFLLVLLILKGFFSGTEMALVNSDKVKLNAKANQGHRGSQLVLALSLTLSGLAVIHKGGLIDLLCLCRDIANQ